MTMINKFILFLAKNPCEDTSVLNVIYYIRKILGAAFVIVPIVLIFLIIFDCVKNVLAGNEETIKKNQKIIIKRIIYCVLFFFVMPITNLAFSAFETSGQSNLISGTNNVNYLSCWANAKDKNTILSFKNEVNFDPDGGSIYGEPTKKCDSSGSCEVIAPNASKKGYIFLGWSNDGGNTKYKTGQKITINDVDVYTAIWQEKAKEEEVITDEDKINQDNNPPADEENTDNPPSVTIDPTTGSFIGTKYNLTDAELKGLAYLCYREQGTATGAAYEAALIANRFELDDRGYDNIADFAAGCGWWNSGSSYVNNPGSVSSDVLEAVKDVLVNGNRPMPQYVDEHDCIDCGSYGFDIVKLEVNGKTITDESGLLNRSNYIQGETVIYNAYGAVYTFWVFPTETSDPFGYTSSAYNQVMGN